MSLELRSELPKMNMDLSETGCCPRFDPTDWEGKLYELKDLRMVRASTKSLFFMPLNMGAVMGRTMKAIDEANAAYDDRYLILSKDKSSFTCDHYFNVTKEVAGQQMADLSGQYVARVFEGSYAQVPKWIPEMEAYVKSEGFELEALYQFYTTCPKCAKHFGKNYIVFFGRVHAKQ